RRYKITVVRKARHRPVIQGEPVLPQHEAVAGARHRQRRERVDVKPIEEGAGICAVEIDLAQSRDIAEAYALAHRADFAVDRFEPMVFAGSRKILRAQPWPGFREYRALDLGPRMRRGAADGTERLAAMMSGEGADRDRRAGRPMGCDPGFGNRTAGQRRHDGQTGEIGGTALVGCHAKSGVTLEMLDRAESLALRKRNV